MTITPTRRRFLQGSLAAGTVFAMGSAHSSERAGDANPAVRPGRVRWHDNFAAARAASQRSGKPVLLFHMLGRLDEKFC